MTKKEKEVITIKLEEICERIGNIYRYHNKNLTNEQYHKLGECLELLEQLGVKY